MGIYNRGVFDTLEYPILLFKLLFDELTECSA